MLGKTHMVVGIATALSILKPNTLQELILGTGAAAIGGMICDIDVSTSESNQEAGKIIEVTLIIIIVVTFFDYYYYTGIVDKVLQSNRTAESLGGVTLFLFLCIFGKNRAHRSFMHSFLALFLFCGAVFIVIPSATRYFAVAYLTHILTDLLNRKKVRLFYPRSGGFCLNLFASNGVVNELLFLGGSIASVLQIVMLTWTIYLS